MRGVADTHSFVAIQHARWQCEDCGVVVNDVSGTGHFPTDQLEQLATRGRFSVCPQALLNALRAKGEG